MQEAFRSDCLRPDPGQIPTLDDMEALQAKKQQLLVYQQDYIDVKNLVNDFSKQKSPVMVYSS